MLDFSKLQTPPRDGDVLVIPDPTTCRLWVTENRRALDNLKATLLGRSLSDWRREARRAIVGRDDVPIIVTGHQPAFVHPGVWAKHVVAQRLAQAADGITLNLVVDSDAPKSGKLTIPAVKEGRVMLLHVEVTGIRPGYAYEQLKALDEDQIDPIERSVRDVMGKRYAESQMNAFFKGFADVRPRLSSGSGGPDDTSTIDWVTQMISGRRAIERRFDIELLEHRVSQSACTPLTVDMLLNAEHFADAYNRALAGYRRAERVRHPHRPIPDLVRDEERFELPLWVYRACEARRRLFVRRKSDALYLYADRDAIGTIAADGLESEGALYDRIRALDGWRIRPRALALTIWARLLLADLFIHGIGGAKYDRISDAIMADYYGVEPPRMACVSATLHLDLQHEVVSNEDVRRFERTVRDIRYNPQRYARQDEAVDRLIRQRAEAVRQSHFLRESDPDNHRERHAVFKRIRALNMALLNAQPDILAQAERQLEQARQARREGLWATGREYFFGLYGSDRLHSLLDALPAEREFRL
jgi:hypothetical protein